MKPKPQKNQGKFNKKSTPSNAKAGQKQKPNFKQKYKQKNPASVCLRLFK